MKGFDTLELGDKSMSTDRAPPRTSLAGVGISSNESPCRGWGSNPQAAFAAADFKCEHAVAACSVGDDKPAPNAELRRGFRTAVATQAPQRHGDL